MQRGPEPMLVRSLHLRLRNHALLLTAHAHTQHAAFAHLISPLKTGAAARAGDFKMAACTGWRLGAATEAARGTSRGRGGSSQRRMDDHRRNEEAPVERESFAG